VTVSVVHVVAVIVIPDSTDPTLYYKYTFDGNAESANVIIHYLEMVVDKILSLHGISQFN
jgi:hypothetical protein